MKTAFSALFGAVGSTLAQPRLVFLLWLVNAAVALVLVAPLFDAIDTTVAHNPLASTALTSFDDEVLVDFENTHAPTLDATLRGVRTAALPFVLLSSILAMGVLTQLTSRRGGPGLLAGCGRHGHRAFWLLATTLLALWGLSFGSDALSGWITRSFTEGVRDASAGLLGWTMTARSALVVLAAGALLTAHRVARLRVVLGGERFVPLTWLRALASVLRHPLAVGTASILSLLPLLLVGWAHLVASDALLANDGWLPGVRLEWRMLLLFQVTLLLVQAALVYRAAVDVRLWPLLRPSDGAPVDPIGPSDVDPLGQGVAAAGGAALLFVVASAGVLLAFRGETPADAATAAPALPVATTAAPAPPATLAAASAEPAVAAPLAQDASAPPPPARPAALDAPAFVPAATPRRPELRNRYAMDVTLDLAGHTADARQRATFVNTTDAPVPDLWMHLYAAAFSNDRTIYMRESALLGRNGDAVAERGEADGGGIEIRSVRLEGAELGDAVSIAGDERDVGDGRDASLMHVRLPAPVPPGGQVTLEIDFTTRFPRTVARMGMTGLHLDGMQWFPKFCAHDAGGWRNRPFWSTGEFFADFGSYDVTFTWPTTIDEHPVELEATGVPHELVARGDGMQTRRYLATDVHDFAFTADPAFQRIEREWTAPDGRKIPVVYLCQPYALPKADLVLDVVLTCLDRSAEWWMPYPWPRLVIDGLPFGQGGGMEYPMLFTISQNQPNHLASLVDLSEDPAGVTAHEFGHQYWYGVMASDEVDEAWLDEGINTWSTNRFMDAWRPSPGRVGALTFLRRDLACGVANGSFFGSGWLDPAQVVGWSESPFRSSRSLLGFGFPGVRSLALDDMGVDRVAWEKARYADVAKVRPLSAPSRDFTRGYGPIVYSKTGLAMATLERHLGRDGMDRLMRRYVESFAFRHPTADDFLSLVEAEGGRPARTLFEQLVRTNGTVDFAVEEVRSVEQAPLVGFRPQRHPGDPFDFVAAEEKPARPSRPFWERWWGAVFETPFPGHRASDDAVVDAAHADGSGAPPIPGEGDATRGDDAIADDAGANADANADAATHAAPPLWISRYVVRQKGEIEAPVEIEARFADGSVQRETWDGRGGYHIVRHESSAPMVSVVVDPERRFALDLDRNDNGWQSDDGTRTARTLDAFVHFVTQCDLAGWQLLF
ncbi:MAG: M1 family metallopeptidase [Planctomycetes bacterium]|nr:M1 family metallopeptidase [Planctomycetota bacterium]